MIFSILLDVRAFLIKIQSQLLTIVTSSLSYLVAVLGCSPHPSPWCPVALVFVCSMFSVGLLPLRFVGPMSVVCLGISIGVWGNACALTSGTRPQR